MIVMRIGSGRLPCQHGSSGLNGAAPCRDRIKVVRFDPAFRQDEDFFLHVRLGIARSAFVPRDRADRAAKARCERVLGQPLFPSPVGKFHVSTTQIRPLPKWLYDRRVLWQYANMAISQIGYIRRVANDDEPSNRIREIRDMLGISQAELARRIHTEPSTLNKIELGNRRLDQQWMRRISTALGVTPAELLPLSDNPMLLTEAEREIIARYRQADAGTREQLVRVTEAIVPYRASEHKSA